jgi:hypothetical protein
MSDPIFAVQDAALDDLRVRLENTRWPSVVAGRGWERGKDLDYLRGLVDYWRSSFGWQEPEAFARELIALAREVVPETSHG